MAELVILAITTAITVAETIYQLVNRPGVAKPQQSSLQISDSQPGASIPFGYGVVRLGSQIIWTTGITYKTKTQSAKGGPSVTTYYYYASLAVAFCEGPASIKRVWADTKLIYDADPNSSTDYPIDNYDPWDATQLYNPGNLVAYNGQVWDCLLTNTGNAPFQGSSYWLIQSDYPAYLSTVDYAAGDVVSYVGVLWVAIQSSSSSSPHAPSYSLFTLFGATSNVFWEPLSQYYPTPSFYSGTETQTPDPLIQGAEGAANTPAYRGLCYMVFENLPLANFGNRIPSLRAEIIFKNGTVSKILNGNFETGDLTDWTAHTTYLDDGEIGLGVGAGASRITPVVQSSVKHGGTYALRLGPGVLTGPFFGGPPPVPWNLCGVHQIINTLPGVVYSFSFWYNYIRASSGDPTGSGLMQLALQANGQPAGGFITVSSNTGWVQKTGSFTAQYNRTQIDLSCFYSGAGSVYVDDVVITGPEGVDATVDEVCLDLCERSGLEASQIDVSQLTALALSPTNVVQGYAIDQQRSGAEALKPLLQSYFFDGCESGGKVVFVPRGGASVLTIPEADLGLLEDGGELEETQQQAHDLPQRVTVTFNDPALDYQQNKQMRQRNTLIVGTKQQLVISVPMTMDKDWALQVAEKSLFLQWLARESFKMRLWRAIYLRLDPTDVVQFVYQGITFQVRLMSNSNGQGFATELDTVSDSPSNYLSTAVGGSNSGFSPAPLAAIGPTQFFLFDMPLMRDSDSNPGGTGFYFAMFSPVSGWAGGVLYDSFDNSDFADQDASTVNTTLGYTTGTLAAPRSPWTWDNVNTLTIAMKRGTLTGDSMLNVLNGKNALLVGDELIQYTTAVDNGDGTFTISGLLRGRRGTEWACGTHATGELVIAPLEGMVRHADSITLLNRSLYYRGITVGQDVTTGVSKSFTVTGQDLMPYAPIGVGGYDDGSGNFVITWQRRTRLGGDWVDGSDVPLSEDTELYDVEIMNGSTVVRTISDLTAPTAIYTVAMQTADFGSPPASVAVRVYQRSAQVGRGFVATGTAPTPGAWPPPWPAVSSDNTQLFYINGS